MSVPASSPAPVPPARFHLAQKITPMQNVYRVHADAAGEPGPLIAFAKQKRLAFKEQFTLYRDESGASRCSRSRPTAGSTSAP